MKEYHGACKERGSKGSMTNKIYYFFCQTCGGDTAAYNSLVRCPYCHANQTTFHLLADSEGPGEAEVSLIIDKHRLEWSAKNGVAFADALPKKNKAWFRR